MILHRNNKTRGVLYFGDCLDLIESILPETVDLIVTSPPYNLKKEYEKSSSLEEYLDQQKKIIEQFSLILSCKGSICYQTGNYVSKGEIFPLDILLYPIFKQQGFFLRNRIIWKYPHGLHCTKRFSGRYEIIFWFTKEDYFFDVDPVRIPQNEPFKRYFKGPNKGKVSSNPLGKNPEDVWEINNVRHNHIEKTDHPAQFPIELVENLILSMTKKDAVVFDPFGGSGTTAVAAIRQERKFILSEKKPEYFEIIVNRIKQTIRGMENCASKYPAIYTPENRLLIR